MLPKILQLKNKQPIILAVFRCFKEDKISGQHCTALYTNIFNEPRDETLPLLRKIHYSLFTNREHKNIFSIVESIYINLT